MEQEKGNKRIFFGWVPALLICVGLMLLGIFISGGIRSISNNSASVR